MCVRESERESLLPVRDRIQPFSCTIRVIYTHMKHVDIERERERERERYSERERMRKRQRQRGRD